MYNNTVLLWVFRVARAMPVCSCGTHTPTERVHALSTASD